MVETSQRAGDASSVVPARQFMSMLKDEIYRAERYGIPMSLIMAYAPSASAGERFSNFAVEHLRQVDAGTTLAAGIHVVCLPHTSSSRAEAVGMRLKAALRGAAIGVVTCPEDGRTVEQLVASAEGLIRASRRTIRTFQSTSR